MRFYEHDVEYFDEILCWGLRDKVVEDFGIKYRYEEI